MNLDGVTELTSAMYLSGTTFASAAATTHLDGGHRKRLCFVYKSINDRKEEEEAKNYLEKKSGKFCAREICALLILSSSHLYHGGELHSRLLSAVTSSSTNYTNWYNRKVNEAATKRLLESPHRLTKLLPSADLCIKLERKNSFCVLSHKFV